MCDVHCCCWLLLMLIMVVMVYQVLFACEHHHRGCKSTACRPLPRSEPAGGSRLLLLLRWTVVWVESVQREHLTQSRSCCCQSDTAHRQSAWQLRLRTAALKRPHL